MRTLKGWEVFVYEKLLQEISEGMRCLYMRSCCRRSPNGWEVLVYGKLLQEISKWMRGVCIWEVVAGDLWRDERYLYMGSCCRRSLKDDRYLYMGSCCARSQKGWELFADMKLYLSYYLSIVWGAKHQFILHHNLFWSHLVLKNTNVDGCGTCMIPSVSKLIHVHCTCNKLVYLSVCLCLKWHCCQTSCPMVTYTIL